MRLPIAKASEQDFQSSVSPLFLLRVAGLPFDEIDELRFAEVADWRDRALALEERLLQGKDEAVAILHKAVALHKEDQALRRRLIQLKRDLFNLRLADGIEQARSLLNVLPPEKAPQLNAWLDLCESYQQTLAAGPRIFARELAEKRSIFKKIIATPDFRKGLLLSSTLLDQAVERFLASDNLHPNREARTVERSLSEYLLRASCKTSPFSTFTSVCIGEFAERGGHMVYKMESMEKKSFIRLNVGILSRLSSLLLQNAEARRAMQVQVIRDWRLQGNRVQYMRRRQEIEDVEDTIMLLDLVHESLFSLPAGRLLRDILALLGDGHSMLFNDVVCSLCAHERYHGAEREIEAYLSHLLQLGFLLVPALQVDIHSQHPPRTYRAELQAISSPLTAALAQHLETIEREVESYACAELAERRTLLSSVRKELESCFHLLGQAQPALPRSILYEDTTLRPQKLTLPLQESDWRGPLTDLAEFQRLLPLFQSDLPLKLLTRGYFRARYGQGAHTDDFLAFAHAFLQDYFGPYQKDAVRRRVLDGSGHFKRHELSTLFPLPELNRLDEGRQAVADYLNTAWAKLPEERTELVLGDDFLETISSYVPRMHEELQAHAFFAQFARISPEPLLVINQVFSGLTPMFSRFAHCFSGAQDPQMAATLRATLAELQPQGAVFAELKGGYDATNLNLHPAITAYELVCPGERSTRPPEQQIPLSDLSLLDDERANRLRLYSRRLGKEVIPLYLGFLLPLVLPDIQQILLQFSYQNLPILNLWAGVTPPCKPAQDAVAFYPRLRYKHLVLQRAQWRMPATVIPRRAEGMSEAEFFLTLSRWRKEYALPARVFFTATHDETEQKGWAAHKPLYLDFENFFSFSLLAATMRKNVSQIIMREMLPGREDLWFAEGGHPYVSEFVLEMNRRRRP